MAILQIVSSLALRPVIDGACKAAGLPPGARDIVGKVTIILQRHFADQSQRLTAALVLANQRAWQSLEIALAGDTLWERCRVLVSSGEQKAFREQVRIFLEATPLSGVSSQEFRRQCLEELRQARKAQAAARERLDPGELAQATADFARFANPQALLDADWRALERVAEALRHAGCIALAQLVGLRPPQGDPGAERPILVVAARYFFRRAVETDQQLFQGLAFAQLERLGHDQEAGFAALDHALTEHAQRLESLLDEVHGVVVETHGAVLDIRTEQARQGASLQEIYQAVMSLKQRLSLHNSAVQPRDSISLHSETERRLVHDVLARFRALPEGQQRSLPALRNSLAQLEVATGDFASAQQAFRAVAETVTEPSARAEAHHNAYYAALERRAFDEALRELLQAAAIDPRRFAPFPFEKYEPQRILGAGGFGVAFLCKHRNTSSLVVVKSLRTDGLERDLSEVFAEARMLEELEHPNIIRLRDCDYADSEHARPYLVMDYFESQTLADHVSQHGPLPSDEMLTVARLTAEGLAAAHGRGILHRDVKPANLLVRRDASGWRVKLIDFGLALKQTVVQQTVASPGNSRTTMGSSIAGTIDYAAPEQLGRLPGVAVGPASDVYGFGKTCCYALFQTPQPAFQHWRKVPEALAELLGECLSEQPQQRPAGFVKLLEKMKHLDGHRARPKESTEAVDVLPADEPAKRRHEGALEFFERGERLFSQGAYDRAIVELNEALRLDPTLANAYELRANAHVARGDDERAIADFTQALRFNPSSISAYEFRGRTHFRRQDHERALADLHAAIRISPGAAELYDTRGEIYAGKGDYNSALTDFDQAIRLRPSAGYTFIHRGQVYSARGEFKRAIADYSEALRIDARLVWAYIFRARAHIQRDEYDHAVADFEAALKLEPNNQTARAGLDKARKRERDSGRHERVRPSQRKVKARSGPSCGGCLLLLLCLAGIGFAAWAIWFRDSGEIGKFEGHTGAVTSVAFSPDGKRILSGGADKTLRIWDVETRKETRIEGNHEAIECVAFAPDGKRLVAGGESLIRVWDAESGRELMTLVMGGGTVGCLAISGDGRMLMAGTNANYLNVWDMNTGQLLGQMSGTAISVHAVAFAPDNQTALSIDGNTGHDDNVIRTWQVPFPLETRRIERQAASCLVCSPNGKYVLVGSYAQNGAAPVYLWDRTAGHPPPNPASPPPLGTPSPVRRFDGHTGNVNSVAFTPDSKRAVSAAADKTIRVWDVESGKEVKVFKGHTGNVRSVAISPDGKRMVSAGDDATLRLWKMPD